MASYPNQRTVIMPKKGERKRNKENKYGMFSIEAAKDVAKLGYSTFMLYIIISKNQDEYEYELSPTSLEKEWGMKKDAYATAFKKLVDNGYLLPKCANSSIYYFHEFPIIGNTVEEFSNQVRENHTRTAGKSIEENTSKNGKAYDTNTEKPIRNNTDNTIINNTENTLMGTENQRFSVPFAAYGGEGKKRKKELEQKLDELKTDFNDYMMNKYEKLGKEGYYAYKQTEEYEILYDKYYIECEKIRIELRKIN